MNDMKKYVLYMHGGSGNHGCEALVRTVSALLGEETFVYSKRKKEDEFYINDMKDIMFVDNGNALNKLSVFTKFRIKYLKQKYAFVDTLYKNLLKNMDSNTIAFSIGGDNYCYDGLPEVLRLLNLKINKAGAKTVLYGCSIEPELLCDKKIVEDLDRYSLIVARESITYDALQKAGLKNEIILASDPAFTLTTKINDDADELIGDNTVGVNLSPLVLEGGNQILYEAYCRLIEWVISATDMNIALIPHVVWQGNDDRNPLQSLYDLYKNSKRITIIEDHNVVELKGYISKCRFFVGARTHSTIAAYSSKVPTLVAGYSIKSKGIAKDIFGTDHHYVVDTNNLQSDLALVESFQWLVENEDAVRKRLNDVMPEYIENSYAAVNAIKSL